MELLFCQVQLSSCLVIPRFKYKTSIARYFHVDINFNIHLVNLYNDISIAD